ncbi:hypothetical protein TWF730_010191 [Orbilia blumenaviensis]|uniref:Uncharacterized protein n=1 Tax=Orbilia blumenaviensis TaxID=1796055 RepID=A0AAV9UMN2_9PEZI
MNRNSNVYREQQYQNHMADTVWKRQGWRHVATLLFTVVATFITLKLYSFDLYTPSPRRLHSTEEITSGSGHILRAVEGKLDYELVPENPVRLGGPSVLINWEVQPKNATISGKEYYFDRVSHTYPNITEEIEKRATQAQIDAIPVGTLSRLDNDWGLRAISLRQGEPDEGKYYYDSREGRSNNTFVYVFGDGFYLQHSEFRHNPVHQFIDIQPGVNDTSKVPPIGDEVGTTLLSKVLGLSTGTAPYANVIAVRVHIPREAKEANRELITKCLKKVLEDMRKKAREALQRGDAVAPRFVVNISWMMSFDLPSKYSSKYVKNKDPTGFAPTADLDKSLVEISRRQDVLMVVAANPNAPRRSKSVYEWPHRTLILDMPLHRSNVIFVEGAQEKSMLQGSRRVITTFDSPGNHILEPNPRRPTRMLAAPSENVRAAAIEMLLEKETKRVTGFRDYGVAVVRGSTALAGATVSGVLATFLADGRLSAAKARQRLFSLAYPRSPGSGNNRDSLAMIWNGEWRPSSAPPPGPGQRPRPLPIYVINYLDACEAPAPKPTQVSDHARRDTNDSEKMGNETATETAITVEPLWQTLGANTLETTTTTITRCEIATSLVALNSPPVVTAASGSNVYVGGDHEELCVICKKSNGEVPLNGIIYIPSDCPC